MRGSVGVGHTRWATHGPPSQRNAHPHSSPDGDLVVVQNGIVENFLELRRQLQEEGYTFLSDTDTEVIVHLIHRNYHNGCAGDLERAVRHALLDLQGPSAVVVLSRRHPDRLIAARLGNAGGVAVGYGDGRDVPGKRYSGNPAPHAAHYVPREPADGGDHGCRRHLFYVGRRSVDQGVRDDRLEPDGSRKG